LNEIEIAVKNLTNHESVNVSIHTSTSDDTGITVTLYNYHVERFTVDELKNKAASIDSTIKKINPEWGNLKSRVIKYTSSANPDENDNVISFKFPLQYSK
jgi:hypothetical protein